jgi:dimethylargininase
LVTHIDKQEVNFDVAAQQWHKYTDAMAANGWQIREIAPPNAQNDLADSVFIEDVLVIFDGQGGVITRPGSPARLPEIVNFNQLMIEAGLGHIPLRALAAPAQMDGGDVLKIGKTVFVGVSGTRTNMAAVDQLRGLLPSNEGWRVVSVPMVHALHLKSACTALPDGTIIYWPPALDDEGIQILTSEQRLSGGTLIAAPEEAGAHVVVLSESRVLMAESAVATKALLEREHGLEVVTVPLSEFEKLEGCVTCLSVRVR